MLPSNKNRRDFLKTASLATLATVGIPSISLAVMAEEKPNRIKLSQNDVILFQGDSITDWGRDQKLSNANASNSLGSGYVLVTAAQLLAKYPSLQLKCYNKGISGNKVYQLAERWDADCLSIQPNVLSIHIGVNDYWHTITSGYKGTIETYRSDYHKLLDRTFQALPNLKLIIMEPFGVKGVRAVNDSWYPAFDQYRKAAHDIAQEYKAVFIPLQSIFDKALDKAPGEYWTTDGVHPSVAGEGLIARAWVDAVSG